MPYFAPQQTALRAHPHPPRSPSLKESSRRLACFRTTGYGDLENTGWYKASSEKHLNRGLNNLTQNKSIKQKEKLRKACSGAEPFLLQPLPQQTSPSTSCFPSKIGRCARCALAARKWKERKSFPLFCMLNYCLQGSGWEKNLGYCPSHIRSSLPRPAPGPGGGCSGLGCHTSPPGLGLLCHLGLLSIPTGERKWVVF